MTGFLGYAATCLPCGVRITKSGYFIVLLYHV